MREREFYEPSEAELNHRREVLAADPTTRPIFHELSPTVQEYVRIEHTIFLAGDSLSREEKKALHERLAQQGRAFFSNRPGAEKMREEITAYGEVISDEMMRPPKSKLW